MIIKIQDLNIVFISSRNGIAGAAPRLLIVKNAAFVAKSIADSIRIPMSKTGDESKPQENVAVNESPAPVVSTRFKF